MDGSTRAAPIAGAPRFPFPFGYEKGGEVVGAPVWGASAGIEDNLLKFPELCSSLTRSITPAMAAGVTARLWSLIDMVQVIEKLEGS
jgi:hypothetical protein